MELYTLPIHELHKKLKAKEVSSQEIVQSYIQRIKVIDKTINSYITVLEEPALKQAEKADEQIARGEVEGSPLLGIPIGIKDLICTKGVRTTCASKMLETFVPSYDATVMTRLQSAGAIAIGKLNLDEFAMGSSTENSFFGATKNPWNQNYVPGGSSGGSSAAVAAGECAAALGSDTGGSIRQPASFCGVVGLKPTYGRVSRFGLVAFASSLDQIGPITADVKDTALLMNVLSGKDTLDTTSANVVVPDFTASLKKDIRGLRIGIPEEYFIEGVDPEVEKAVLDAITALEGLGAEKVKISLPHTGYAVPAYYVIAPAETSSNLARYDGVKYGYRSKDADDLLSLYKKTRKDGFGSEVKRRIMLGTYGLSAGYYDAYYLKAQKVRTLIKRDFDNAFNSCDVIVAPVSPTAAFRMGEKAEDPLQMYLTDVLTISANLSGIPAISVPCGFTSQRLPVGLQIMGKHFDEERIIQTAYAYEQATDYHTKRPEL